MTLFFALLLLGLIKFSATWRVMSRVAVSKLVLHESSSFNKENDSQNTTSSTLTRSKLVPFDSKIVEDSFAVWSEQNKASKAIIPTGPDTISNIDDKIKSKVLAGVTSIDALRYFKIVEGLAPNEMLFRFAKSAPSQVQEATKTTIINILGSLPNYALDATMLTTSSKLANLLYQMQITGYMFKNAEYRMSFTRELKGTTQPYDTIGCLILSPYLSY
jgi:hypothetical protein